MTGNIVSTLPAQLDVRIRQVDRGRDNPASTIGMIRLMEEARLRLRLPRSERLVAAGGVEPVRPVLVSQSVERLAVVTPAETTSQVNTGIRRIGRSPCSMASSAWASPTPPAPVATCPPRH